MTNNADWELQSSLYTALKNDVALIGLVADIYDFPPADAKLPYISLGEIITTDWSAKDFQGCEHVMILHVWDETPGRKNLKLIMGGIETALENSSLELNGHQLTGLSFEFSETRLDPDGKTHHGIMRYRARTRNTG